MERMPDNGRTQRRLSVESEAAPQRIDLGHGKARTIAGTASARTSAVARPGLSITANRIFAPFASSRETSCSRVNPAERSATLYRALQAGPYAAGQTLRGADLLTFAALPGLSAPVDALFAGAPDTTL